MSFLNKNRAADGIIDHTLISSNLSGVPLFLNTSVLPAEIYDSADSNRSLTSGGDIEIFTDATGSTRVPLEIVRFEYDNTRQELWFKRDVLVSIDTPFTIAWNEVGGSQPPVTDTYGRNKIWDDRYQLVAHLDEDPSLSNPTETDSSGTGNDLSSVNTWLSSDLVDSKVGKGLTFDGVHYLKTSSALGFPLGNSDHTYEVSFKHQNTTVQKLLAEAGQETTNNADYLEIGHLGNNKLAIGLWGSHVVTSPNTLTPGTWHVGCLVYTASTTTYNLVEDGSSVATQVKSGVSLGSGGSTARVGSWSGGGRFIGEIDEARFSDQALSNDFLNLQYITLHSPSSLITIGAPYDISGDSTPPTITAQNPANGDTGVAIDSSVYFELDDDSSGVDSSTINVTIEGVSAITNGVFQTGYSGMITADGSGIGYDVTINHDVDWTYAQVINVVVDCDDIDGNSMVQEVYSFTCVGAPASGGGADRGSLSPDILARTKKKFLLPDIMIN